jgi:Glycosyl transferase family 2
LYASIHPIYTGSAAIQTPKGVGFQFPHRDLLNSIARGSKGWPGEIVPQRGFQVSTSPLRRSLKFSIVTPSYNSELFIEQTIASVLEQSYDNLELIIIDGGSSDNTVQIIKKYEPYIANWVSEPDNGQASAINKGFRLATGDVFAWLNSDDTYEPGVISKVAERFHETPRADVISGCCKLWYGDHRDRLIGPSPLRTYSDFLRVNSNWMSDRLIIQPEAFFRKAAYTRANGLREGLRYCLDVSLWMELARNGCVFHSVNEHWANLRMHRGQKTFDLGRAYHELLQEAWRRVQNDREILDDPWTVATDIVAGWDRLLTESESKTNTLKQSTSYRFGRTMARLKFW